MKAQQAPAGGVQYGPPSSNPLYAGVRREVFAANLIKCQTCQKVCLQVCLQRAWGCMPA